MKEMTAIQQAEERKGFVCIFFCTFGIILTQKFPYVPLFEFFTNTFVVIDLEQPSADTVLWLWIYAQPFRGRNKSIMRSVYNFFSQVVQ